MYRLKGFLTYPSLQDSPSPGLTGARPCPVPVAVFGFARNNSDFFDDTVANRRDFSSARPAGSRICWPGDLDRSAVFLFAICFFLLADKPWLHNTSGYALLGSLVESFCNRRIEMCKSSLSPPRVEGCARRKKEKEETTKEKIEEKTPDMHQDWMKNVRK